MGDTCCGGTTPCTSKEHKGHLCVLASAKQFDLIKALADTPKFICFTCGRVAKSRKNLCTPMPLK